MMRLRHASTGSVVDVPDRLADKLKGAGFSPASEPAAERSDGQDDQPKRRGRPPKRSEG